MQLNGPTFVPKAVLTTGRVLHQPFEVPTEMTKSALLEGGTTHDALGAINKAAATAVENLQPRGPAKLLSKLFGRIDASLVTSANQAKTATEMIWVPLSNGMHQIGHSVSNPFALFYAKRAGFEIPSDAEAARTLLASITDPNPDSTKFPGANWPTPKAPDSGGNETPPPTDGGDGGKTPPPTDGGSDTTPPPTDGGDGQGGETPPPTDGGSDTTPPPTDGSDGQGGETPPPTDGGITDSEATPGASETPDGATS